MKLYNVFSRGTKQNNLPLTYENAEEFELLLNKVCYIKEVKK